jgi:phosphoribosylglycinamide formyltransferase 2
MNAAALAEAQRSRRRSPQASAARPVRRRAVRAGDTIYFSEVSPRPHDTGLVTLVSQDLSEFALHARAILGLPIPVIRQRGPSASCALLVDGDSGNVSFTGVDARSPNPIPPSGCSASPRCGVIGAWACRWRWATPSSRRAPKHAP